VPFLPSGGSQCEITGCCRHAVILCYQPVTPLPAALQMLTHLGDFPARLAEHGHAVYEYTPCPPVGYPHSFRKARMHPCFIPPGSGTANVNRSTMNAPCSRVLAFDPCPSVAPLPAQQSSRPFDWAT